MKSIFEKIIDNEIPSFKIYENKDFVVILDAFPKSKGHTLIIPKKKKENFLKETKKIQSDLIILADKISKQIIKNLKASGVKIQINVGKSAGQEVFHTHLHIIPYYSKIEKPVVNQEIVNQLKK